MVTLPPVALTRTAPLSAVGARTPWSVIGGAWRGEAPVCHLQRFRSRDDVVHPRVLHAVPAPAVSRSARSGSNNLRDAARTNVPEGGPPARSPTCAPASSAINAP